MTNFMTKAISLLLISMVMSSPLAQSAVSCGQVAATIAPCVDYTMRGGPTVPVACCRGAASFFNELKTTPYLQQGCRCLKTIASGIPGVNEKYVVTILPKCGISAPFKVSMATDCNRVHL